MNWRKYKTKLSNTSCSGLVSVIDYMLDQLTPQNDMDRVFLANLAEVSQHLKTKLVDYRTEYKCTFTPAQAIAIRVLITEYLLMSVKQIGEFETKMLLMANQIHQNYTI